MENNMTREEEEQAFIQSLKALIQRAIDNYKNIKIGDVVSALEYEKTSLIIQHFNRVTKKE